MGVSADAPFVDSVYKLVEYEGRPVLKLSPAKMTAPGPKQVFRMAGFEGDVVSLRDEPAPEGAEPLLEPVMEAGRRVGPSPGLEASRGRFETDLAALPAEVRRLRGPRAFQASVSEQLGELTVRVRRDLYRSRPRRRPAMRPPP